MKNAKKFLCFLVLGCVLCTSTYNIYQTCYASELVVAGGLASGGTALLGLLAMAGVGMELENNKKFNELSNEEKTRIENGLAQNYEDVALQRGASLEKIKTWTNDLCNGVLDKASECWGIFKDWARNIHLTETSFDESIVNGKPMSPDELIGMSWTVGGTTQTINANAVSMIKSAFNIEDNDKRYIGWMVYGGHNVNGNITYVVGIPNIDASVVDGTTGTQTYVFGSGFPGGTWYQNYGSGYVGSKPINADICICSKPVILDGVDYNGKGSSIINTFSTNTDYLEKLKGQEEDVIDVIDVTDIKNPIVESRGNNIANIDWGRGTRRTNNNNNDDDDKISTALVPMDVWYEAIDDEQEGMQNAIVEYNNYIEEHPGEQGNYFITTQPITNISNYYNVLPVVNYPAPGTVINNNYEYNNINNNNVTIYELPYNTELVPYLPKMIFENKFPFCIPFDIYQFFAMFYVEKEAPRITVPVPFKNECGVFAEELVIDLSDYNYLSDVLRVMSFLLFIVGLMMVTRKLIKG